MVINGSFHEGIVDFMGNLTIGHALIISLQVITDDPLWELAQKGEGTRAIDGNGLLLKDESVSNVWVVGI